MQNWKSAKYWRRVFLIEVVIFTIVGIFCALTGYNYPSALFLLGGLIIVLAFTGSSSYARVNGMPLGSETMEDQMMRDLRDSDQINRLQTMMSDVVVIGLIPPIVAIGMILLS